MNTDKAHFHCKVPAKAMLFGEYGVLFGYPAAAVTFWQEYFEIEAQFTPKQKQKNPVEIESDFFTDKKVFISLEKEFHEKKEQFFYSILNEWQEELKNINANFKIHHSFSPSLGFGSSSALIAGINALLQEYFYPEEKKKLTLTIWQKMYRALLAIQKSGSGYDIAIQFLMAEVKNSNIFLKNSCLKFWKYRIAKEPGGTLPFVEEFTPIEQKESYGCFVKTHLYSDTTESLKLFFMDPQGKEKFAYQHGLLALSFFEDSSLKNTTLLMQNSLNIALEQKILLQEIKFFLENKILLGEHSPRYKTMGAGRGDTLWVLHSQEELLKFGIEKNDIAFCFAQQNYSKEKE
ncbi:MAG: hypothetical protein K2X39_07600 [Silvanigrellaceae bacterium]|nr:hypothetical protein [Silvanigrellaceae bacterium]